MFEERNKGYDFSKYDKHARTQVLVDDKKVEGSSQAYKTLFTTYIFQIYTLCGQPAYPTIGKL